MPGFLDFLALPGVVKVFLSLTILFPVILASWGACCSHGFLGLSEGLLFFHLYSCSVSGLQEWLVIHRVFWVLVGPHVQYPIGHS